MTKKKAKIKNIDNITSDKSVITPYVIDKWRLKYKLTHEDIPFLLGITKSKWFDLKSIKNRYKPIKDKQLIKLFLIYKIYPEIVPSNCNDELEFFSKAGFDIKNRKDFAKYLGFSVSSSYRILEKNKTLSRTRQRFMELIYRLAKTDDDIIPILERINNEESKLS